jgi:TfoX/Sxy family transcriptional regulator of competence genes
MSMPVELEAMRRDLEDGAAPLGKAHDLRFKSLFGGLMAYLDEKPCAWLSLDGLALQLAPTDQPALLQLTGASRLIAKPGAAPSRHYIVVPASLRRDTVELAGWLAKSGRGAANKPASVRSRRHR